MKKCDCDKRKKMLIANLHALRNFCIQEFPFVSSDFDSLTTFELLEKVICYLKSIGELTEEMLEAWEELKKFIDEKIIIIDEKIQAVDDKLADVDARVDSKIREIDTKLNAKIREVDNKIIEIDTKIDEKVAYLEQYIIDYLDNLDFQTLVNNFMSTFVRSPEFKDIIKTYFPFITPELYGAKGDGVTNDTTPIQTMLTENPSREIFFVGDYAVSRGFNCYIRRGAQCIDFGNSQFIIISSGNINRLFTFDREDVTAPISCLRLKNGYFNLYDKVNTCLYISGINVTIENISIFDFNTYGIHIGIDSSNYGDDVKGRIDLSSGNTSIVSCHISNTLRGSEIPNRAGILLESLDNKINNCSILRCEKSIIARPGTQEIINSHFWAGFVGSHTETTKTYAIYLQPTNNNPVISSMLISNCYFDECKYIIGDNGASNSAYFTVNIYNSIYLFSSDAYSNGFWVDPASLALVNISACTVKTEANTIIYSPNFRTTNSYWSTFNHRFDLLPTRTRGDKDIRSCEFNLNEGETRIVYTGEIKPVDYQLIGCVMVHAKSTRSYSGGYLEFTFQNQCYSSYRALCRIAWDSTAGEYRITLISKELIEGTGTLSNVGMNLVLRKYPFMREIEGESYYYYPIYVGMRNDATDSIGLSVQIKKSNNNFDVNFFHDDNNKDSQTREFSVPSNYLKLRKFADDY